MGDGALSGGGIRLGVGCDGGEPGEREISSGRGGGKRSEGYSCKSCATRLGIRELCFPRWDGRPSKIVVEASSKRRRSPRLVLGALSAIRRPMVILTFFFWIAG